ncbi:MAG: hypothetical protein WBD20_01360 [Pirellulaceae bacterium]
MKRFLKNALLPVVALAAIVVCSAQSAEAYGPHMRHMARRAAIHHRVVPVRPVVAVAYRAPVVYSVARPVVVAPVVTPVVTHHVHYPVAVPAYQPVVTYGSYYISY